MNKLPSPFLHRKSLIYKIKSDTSPTSKKPAEISVSEEPVQTTPTPSVQVPERITPKVSRVTPQASLQVPKTQLKHPTIRKTNLVSQSIGLAKEPIKSSGIKKSKLDYEAAYEDAMNSPISLPDDWDDQDQPVEKQKLPDDIPKTKYGVIDWFKLYSILPFEKYSELGDSFDSAENIPTAYKAVEEKYKQIVEETKSKKEKPKLETYKFPMTEDGKIDDTKLYQEFPEDYMDIMYAGATAIGLDLNKVNPNEIGEDWLKEPEVIEAAQKKYQEMKGEKESKETLNKFNIPYNKEGYIDFGKLWDQDIFNYTERNEILDAALKFYKDKGGEQQISVWKTPEYNEAAAAKIQEIWAQKQKNKPQDLTVEDYHLEVGDNNDDAIVLEFPYPGPSPNEDDLEYSLKEVGFTPEQSEEIAKQIMTAYDRGVDHEESEKLAKEKWHELVNNVTSEPTNKLPITPDGKFDYSKLLNQLGEKAYDEIVQAGIAANTTHKSWWDNPNAVKAAEKKYQEIMEKQKGKQKYLEYPRDALEYMGEGYVHEDLLWKKGYSNAEVDRIHNLIDKAIYPILGDLTYSESSDETKLKANRAAKIVWDKLKLVEDKSKSQELVALEVSDPLPTNNLGIGIRKWKNTDAPAKWATTKIKQFEDLAKTGNWKEIENVWAGVPQSSNPNEYLQAVHTAYRKVKMSKFGLSKGKESNIEPIPDKLNAKDWKNVGGQLGGGASGIQMTDSSGKKYYVKFPEKGALYNELMAGKIYQLAGAIFPNVSLVGNVSGHFESLGLASEWLKESYKFNPKNPVDVAKASELFALHAWLGNRDCIGPKFDNMAPTSNGIAVIEAGGALGYSGVGNKKSFGPEVSEWNGLRDPKVNANASEVFGAMTEEQMLASAQMVLSISDTDVIAIVDKFANASDKEKLKQILLARKQWIANWVQEHKNGGVKPKKSEKIPPSKKFTPVIIERLKKEDPHELLDGWELTPEMQGKKKAYGGIIFNEKGEVLLREPTNHHAGYHWTFAKGGVESGSNPVETALTEVAQETGHMGDIIGYIPKGFFVPLSANWYFLMHSKGEDKKLMDWETSATKWASLEEAKQLIGKSTNAEGRKRDLDVLDAAVKAYSELKGQVAKEDLSDTIKKAKQGSKLPKTDYGETDWQKIGQEIGPDSPEYQKIALAYTDHGEEAALKIYQEIVGKKTPKESGKYAGYLFGNQDEAGVIGVKIGKEEKYGVWEAGNGKWYVVDDTDHDATKQGFKTKEEAAQWCVRQTLEKGKPKKEKETSEKSAIPKDKIPKRLPMEDPLHIDWSSVEIALGKESFDNLFKKYNDYYKSKTNGLPIISLNVHEIKSAIKYAISKTKKEYESLAKQKNIEPVSVNTPIENIPPAIPPKPVSLFDNTNINLAQQFAIDKIWEGGLAGDVKSVEDAITYRHSPTEKKIHEYKLAMLSALQQGAKPPSQLDFDTLLSKVGKKPGAMLYTYEMKNALENAGWDEKTAIKIAQEVWDTYSKHSNTGHVIPQKAAVEKWNELVNLGSPKEKYHFPIDPNGKINWYDIEIVMGTGKYKQMLKVGKEVAGSSDNGWWRNPGVIEAMETEYEELMGVAIDRTEEPEKVPKLKYPIEMTYDVYLDLTGEPYYGTLYNTLKDAEYSEPTSKGIAKQVVKVYLDNPGQDKVFVHNKAVDKWNELIDNHNKAVDKWNELINKFVPPKLKITIDPNQLPSEPTFATQSPEKKAKKQQAVAELKTLALAGNVQGIKDHPGVPEWDQTGKIQQYKNDLIAAIDFQLNPSPPPKKYEGLLSDLTVTFASAELASDLGAKKLWDWIVTQESGVIDVSWPKIKLPYDNNYQLTDPVDYQKHEDAYQSLSVEARKAMKSYTGGGHISMNEDLRKGSPSPESILLGKEIISKGVELAPGTFLTHVVSSVPSNVVQYLLKSTGMVLQDHGFTSTQIDDYWHGNVRFNLTLGPGVKGIYVAQYSSSGPHERELVLPPGTRYIIQKVWKSGSCIYLEAVVLPTVSDQCC